MQSQQESEDVYMNDNDTVVFRCRPLPPETQISNSSRVQTSTFARNDEDISKKRDKFKVIISVVIAVFFVVTLALFGVQANWVFGNSNQNIELKKEIESTLMTSENNDLDVIQEMKHHLLNLTETSERYHIELQKEIERAVMTSEKNNLEIIQALTRNLSELTDVVERQARYIGILQIEHVVECSKVDRHAFKSGNERRGVFEIYVSRQKVDVYCDHSIEGGGWTVFQRRMDGSVDFFRNHSEYVNGFGSPSGEHWLGLDRLYKILQTSETFQLRIDMEDWDGVKKFAEYSRFDIGAPEYDFTLYIDGYSGTAGDSLSPHNGVKFSTKDHDVDARADNCAIVYKGAWWYRYCHESNLNGIYHKGGAHGSFADGVNWEAWKGYHYSLKSVEMKMKPIL